MLSHKQQLILYFVAYAAILVGILLIIGIEALRLGIVSVVMIVTAYLLRGIEGRSHERTKADALEGPERKETQ